MEGGWFPIKDIKDPSIDVIAKFAIAEHNKQNNSELKLQNVVSGERQSVRGIIFKLIFDVSDGNDGDSKTYEAEVYNWLDSMVLNYFKLVN